MSAFRRDFAHGDEVLSVTLRHLTGDRYQVRVGAAVHEVEASRLPDGRVRVTLAGRTFEADSAKCGAALQVRVAGRTWRLDPAEGRAGVAEGSGVVAAPMTGTIQSVFVSAGDRVEVGAPIAVLTAMKMEHKLSAGIAGTVAELAAEVGATVAEGAVLARIEGGGGEGDSHAVLRREHDEIQAILERARGRDPIRLPAALKELHTLLVRHCTGEEVPGGLFDQIVEREPRFEPSVAKLRVEHTTLLAELLELSYRRQSDERMQRAVESFRQRLEEHERMERELFAGAWPDTAGPPRQ